MRRWFSIASRSFSLAWYHGVPGGVADRELGGGLVGRELVALGLEGVDDLLVDHRVARVQLPRRAQGDAEAVDRLVVGLELHEGRAHGLPHVADVGLVLTALVELARPIEGLDRIGIGLALPRIGEADRDVLQRLLAQLEAGQDALGDAVVVELDRLVEPLDRLDQEVALVVRPGQLVEGLGVERRVLAADDDLVVRADRLVELAGDGEVVVGQAADPGVADQLDVGALPRLAVGVGIDLLLAIDPGQRLLLGRHRRRDVVPLEAVGAGQGQEQHHRPALVLGLAVVGQEVEHRRHLPVGREPLDDLLPQRQRLAVVGDRLGRRVGQVEGLVGDVEVQVGQPEHRVRRELRMVGVLGDELLELLDDRAVTLGLGRGGVGDRGRELGLEIVGLVLEGPEELIAQAAVMLAGSAGVALPLGLDLLEHRQLDVGQRGGDAARRQAQARPRRRLVERRLRARLGGQRRGGDGHAGEDRGQAQGEGRGHGVPPVGADGSGGVGSGTGRSLGAGSVAGGAGASSSWASRMRSANSSFSCLSSRDFSRLSRLRSSSDSSFCDQPTSTTPTSDRTRTS
jgi:hypothetical protein